MKTKFEFARLMQYQKEEYEITNFLSKDTIEAFRNTIKLIFRSELTYEGIRQRLNNKNVFNYYDAFQTFDRENKGFISIESLRSFFDASSKLVPTKDLLILMNRYDKDKDGKISINEFIEELKPKS